MVLKVYSHKLWEMIKRLIIAAIVLVCNLSMQAENTPASIPGEIFTLIYQQNLVEAEQVLRINKSHLNDFYFTFLNLDLHWWKYRTTYSKTAGKELDNLIENSILTEVKTRKQKMRQLIVKSYQMRYAKKKFRLFEMLSARSEMKDLIDEIEAENDQFIGTEQKLFESYLIMFQYIENINFFSNHKKSEERMKKLRRMERFTSEENVILNTIAYFFLARMYQQVEREPDKGLEYYKILTKKYPGNKTFAEYQAECEESV